MFASILMAEESVALVGSASDNGVGKETEDETTHVLALCDPRKGVYRFLILFCVCLSTFGQYICFDMPAALERTIIQVMRVDTTQYELLYSLYSWPSVVLVLVSGVLLDKVLGLRLGLLIFLILSCLGQLLFGLGAILDQYWLMVVGRFILGTGTECSMLCVDVFTADVYNRQQMSFAFGLVFAFIAAGQAVNFNFSHRLYDALNFITNQKIRLGTVLLFGCFSCLLSLSSGVVAAALHYRREKILKKKREKRSHFSLKDIKDFSLSFWLFAFIPAFCFIGVLSFLTITQLFFEGKYGYNIATANFVNSLTYFFPIMGPLVGIAIDWIGFQISWGICAVLLSFVSHYVYTFSGPDYFIPFLCNSLLGISFTLFSCCVWPLGFFLVQEHQMATAYGVTCAFFNLGIALTPIIVGVIVDSLGYLFVQLFFSSAASVCLLLITFLYMVDSISGGGKLNVPGRCMVYRSMHGVAD